MTVNIAAVRRAVDVAVSGEIPHLRERLDWADRDPTIAEAMCLTDREVAYILNVSTRTVSRFVERGDLRAIYLTRPAGREGSLCLMSRRSSESVSPRADIRSRKPVFGSDSISRSRLCRSGGTETHDV